MELVVDEAIRAFVRHRRGFTSEEVAELREYMLDDFFNYDDDSGARWYECYPLEAFCFLTGCRLIFPSDLFGEIVVDVDPEPLCEALIAVWEGLS